LAAGAGGRVTGGIGVVPGTDPGTVGAAFVGTGGSGGMGIGAFCWARRSVPKRSEARRRERTGGAGMNKESFELVFFSTAARRWEDFC
jgi:hypothetical protein